MKAYHFLSKHPKFDANFPRGGSMPPPKNPNSIRKNNFPALEDTVNVDDPNSFVMHLTRSERPASWEHSKHVDAINFIIEKLMQQPAPQANFTTLVETMWSKIEKGLDTTNK